MYQCETGLWRQARQCPGSRLRVFHLVYTYGDPCLLAEEVTKRGEVFRGCRVGRRSYLPLFLVFILLLIAISGGIRLGGSLLPPHPHSCLGGTPKPPPLPQCLLPFVVRMVGLLPRRILRQGDPHGAPCIYPRPCIRTHLH
jgi:hypothetical protein